jgi:hypothetical protein
MRMVLFLALVFLPSFGMAAPGADRPPIGSAIGDFELTDLAGKVQRLSSRSDQRIVLIAFIRADCPLAELYGEVSPASIVLEGSTSSAWRVMDSKVPPIWVAMRSRTR